MTPTESNEREQKDEEQKDIEGAPDAADDRLDLWLDGRLSEDERVRFEAELEHNPEQKQEAHSLASMLSVVRNLPEERAPRTMLADVQDRLRGQTGGRVYGGPKLHVRFPYEALVQSLLLIGAVLFFALASPRPPKLIVMEPRDQLTEEFSTRKILSEFGIFEEEKGTPGGTKYLVGEVLNSQLKALRGEVSRHPGMMTIVSELPSGEGRTRVKVSLGP